jgi:hypothetical protein
MHTPNSSRLPDASSVDEEKTKASNAKVPTMHALAEDLHGAMQASDDSDEDDDALVEPIQIQSHGPKDAVLGEHCPVSNEDLFEAVDVQPRARRPASNSTYRDHGETRRYVWHGQPSWLPADKTQHQFKAEGWKAHISQPP